MQSQKRKKADTILDQIITADKKTIAHITSKILANIHTETTSNQILSLAVLFLVFLEKYNLSHINVLSEADNQLHSGINNNMDCDFKKIMKNLKG